MKRQPNFTPTEKNCRSVVRMAAMLLAAAALVYGAARLAQRLSPVSRLSRRTAALAASVMVQQEALPPLEIARRLSATESALAPDAVAEFTWPDGGTWSVEGRRELKDLHARLLAEAPRLGLALDGLAATAERTANNAIETTARAALRITGETTVEGPLLATLRWNKTPDGWKIVRADFDLEEAPGP